MNKIKNLIIGSLTVTYLILLIFFSKDVGKAVFNSVNVCIEVIIPSLYAFMVVSGFIVSSNLYAVLSKPFGFIARYVFRIPPEYFSVFLIGSIGGYPVGARLISDMYNEKKIDVETAEQMLSYCYLAGPAFICSIAGVKLFSSVKAGIIIFSSIVLSNFVIAFLSGLKRHIPVKTQNKVKLKFNFENIIKSIYDGAKGIFSICTVIVFFSSIIAVLEKFNIINYAARKIFEYSDLNYDDSIALVKSIVEISNISAFTPNNFKIMPLVASLLSFGGICVLIQIKGFVPCGLSEKHFYFARIISIFFSYFFCKLFIELFDIKYVCAMTYSQIEYSQSSPIPTVFLLIMTILLLSNISIEKTKKVCYNNNR